MKPPETRPEQLLREMTVKYPGVWKFIENCRRDKGTPALPDDWPDWCYCPMSAAHAWVFQSVAARLPRMSPDMWLERMGDMQLISALAGWRMGRGVYRFDPALSAALLATPLTGRVPVELLYHLPEWSLYIEAPPSWPDNVRGFFVHLERDANTGRSELRLLFDFADQDHQAVPLHMHGETIEEMVQSFFDEAARQTDAKGLHLPPPPVPADVFADQLRIADCLNLILYLCDVDADYRGDERPRRPQPVGTKRGPRLFPAARTRVWEVGVHVGERLRLAQAEPRSTPEERAAPRAHLRRAHWHTYRVGEGRQGVRVRWLHPILVGHGKE